MKVTTILFSTILPDLELGMSDSLLSAPGFSLLTLYL